VIERMKLRGRVDDTDKGIAKRISMYKEYTEPVVAHLEASESFILHRIDGSGTPEEVTEGILSALKI
jgi:adenylate kinase family enzyme